MARFGAGEEQVVIVGDLFYAEVEEFAIAPSDSGCRSGDSAAPEHSGGGAAVRADVFQVEFRGGT